MRLADISTVGVVGAGTMGSGIALNFALAGYPTFVNDVSDAVLGRSIETIEAALKLMTEEGLVTRRQATAAVKRLTPTTDLGRLGASSDFVTEAIVERASDKTALFKKLDEMCPPQTIVASNTSWLMLSDFAADVRRQKKLVVTHYFAPAHLVPGVEVGGSPRTSPETLSVAYELMKAIGKVPVRVLKERRGHLLNTIQDAMRHEANRLWAEGAASAEDIELGIISTFGFRSPHEGPMRHWDVAGMWRWPPDIRAGMAEAEVAGQALDSEVREKIREQYASGRPWFVDPAHFAEAVEARDREFARRLKALYRKKDPR